VAGIPHAYELCLSMPDNRAGAFPRSRCKGAYRLLTVRAVQVILAAQHVAAPSEPDVRQ
jgi:hypothetical protein